MLMAKYIAISQVPEDKKRRGRMKKMQFKGGKNTAAVAIIQGTCNADRN